MASHHAIGTGRISATLARGGDDPDRLLDTVAELIEDCGLRVMARKFVAFPNGGQTLVWILAESHLVLHHWRQEGFATIDLHVCDYHASNREKAKALKASLETFCYLPGTERWQEVLVEDPRSQDSTEVGLPPEAASGRSPTAAIK